MPPFFLLLLPSTFFSPSHRHLISLSIPLLVSLSPSHPLSHPFFLSVLLSLFATTVRFLSLPHNRSSLSLLRHHCHISLRFPLSLSLSRSLFVALSQSSLYLSVLFSFCCALSLSQLCAAFLWLGGWLASFNLTHNSFGEFIL